MKSTLFNMVVVLFGVTLVASLGVGAVNMLTKDAIEEAEKKANMAGRLAVLPELENQEEQIIDTVQVTNCKGKQLEAIVYTAKEKDGKVLGYAVEATSPEGFSGDVKLVVGFTPEGKIRNVNVLKQTETPGLGTKMTEEGNKLITSVKDQNPAEMELVEGHLKVVKDGGSVDALTAATISSRAYTDALDCAWAAYREVSSREAVAVDPVVEEPAVEEAEQTQSEEGGNNEK